MDEGFGLRRSFPGTALLAGVTVRVVLAGAQDNNRRYPQQRVPCRSRALWSVAADGQTVTLGYTAGRSVRVCRLSCLRRSSGPGV